MGQTESCLATMIGVVVWIRDTELVLFVGHRKGEAAAMRMAVWKWDAAFQLLKVIVMISIACQRRSILGLIAPCGLNAAVLIHHISHQIVVLTLSRMKHIKH